MGSLETLVGNTLHTCYLLLNMYQTESTHDTRFCVIRTASTPHDTCVTAENPHARTSLSPHPVNSHTQSSIVIEPRIRRHKTLTARSHGRPIYAAQRRG